MKNRNEKTDHVTQLTAIEINDVYLHSPER